MEKGYFKEEGLEDVELITFPDDESAQIEACKRFCRSSLLTVSRLRLEKGSNHLKMTYLVIWEYRLNFLDEG